MRHHRVDYCQAVQHRATSLQPVEESDESGVPRNMFDLVRRLLGKVGVAQNRLSLQSLHSELTPPVCAGNPGTAARRFPLLQTDRRMAAADRAETERGHISFAPR